MLNQRRPLRLIERRNNFIYTVGRDYAVVRKQCIAIDQNTMSFTDADLMLGQRRRRWANIKTALAQYLLSGMR